ncbi:MAG: hypothetical protein J5586_01010 [Clostridia bacterium]|nr:hypothetical protein [Clostridia bacterium]
MKRRHYRIHYNDRTQPMRRVKHKHVEWGSVLLVVLALALAAAGTYAVLRWFGIIGAEDPISRAIRSIV